MTKLYSIADCPPLPEVEGVEFRHCPGFVGYAATDTGDVWSAWVRGGNTRKGRIGQRWRILRPYSDRRKARGPGYRKVRFYCNGPRRDVRISVLVVTAFHGPRPGGMEVCHGDGNRLNDNATNLRWDTHSNNMMDSSRHGTINRMRGEDSPQSKVTNAEAAMIRTLGAYLTLKAIAELYGISQSQVHNIVTRKSRVS